MNLDYLDFLSIIVIVLSLLCCFVLLFFHKNKSNSQRILFFYFLTIALGHYALLVSVINVIYPNFFRTSLFFAYLLPSFSYLYVRENIAAKLKWTDVIIFFPAIFYLIDYMPFFLLPIENKLAIQTYNSTHLNSLLAHNDGWLTVPWFHLVFRNVTNVLFWILSLRLINQFKKNKSATFLKRNKQKIKWLNLFVWLQLSFYIPSLVILVMGKLELSFYATSLPFALICSVIAIFLFLNPTTFYNLDSNQWQEDKEVIASLTNEECDEITIAMDSFIKTNKPFLILHYGLNDFAKGLDLSPKKLSAYLNSCKKMNYNDFINQHRIEYCLKKLHKPDWENLTLEAISKECGFNNRNSFTTAFKKKTGLNPYDYIKSKK